MDIAALSDLRQARRLVIKVGSALLVDKGRARTAWLASLAAEIAELRQTCEVLLVSSGAIALGAARLGLPHGGRGSLADAQAAASVGQVELARLWSDALGAQDITAAQMLVTLGDLEDRRRYLNVSATLGRLLAAGAVPVVNENDSVATEEIRFGDNDRLAARVAAMVGADALVLLSDIDGLYDADPRVHPNATHIAEVSAVTPAVEAMAGTAARGYASGGMVTKLQAAKIALAGGCHMVIADGRDAHPLRALLAGARCTWFVASAAPHSARKRWIAGSLKPKGALRVDDGARRALRDGRSLLPVGVANVTGRFERGDLVTIRASDGCELGRGLCAYSSDDAVLIAGHKTSEIENILGYRGRDEIIHRDDLVLD